MGKKIKYVGNADVRVIPKGTDWGGQLTQGIPNEVRFDESNSFIIDSDEAGLKKEALDLLLEDGDNFKDVTDLQRIPLNRHQRIKRGARTVAAEEVPALQEEQSDEDSGGSASGSKSSSAKKS